MKRTLVTLATNWLRKPQNQERVKRTARDVWGRVQAYRDTRGERDRQNGTPARAGSNAAGQAPPRDATDKQP